MLFAAAGFVIVAAGPPVWLQVPAPDVAVFPESVVVVTAHNDWSVPALAVVGISVTVTCTSLSLAGQGPLLIVHLKV